MQFVRIREKLDQHNKLYFQCWVTTISQEEPRRMACSPQMISHAKTMTPYDASRSLTSSYQGRLYTEQEIVTGAWLQDR